MGEYLLSLQYMYTKGNILLLFRESLHAYMLALVNEQQAFFTKLRKEVLLCHNSFV